MNCLFSINLKSCLLQRLMALMEPLSAPETDGIQSMSDQAASTTQRHSMKHSSLAGRSFKLILEANDLADLYLSIEVVVPLPFGSSSLPVTRNCTIVPAKWTGFVRRIQEVTPILMKRVGRIGIFRYPENDCPTSSHVRPCQRPSA